MRVCMCVYASILVSSWILSTKDMTSNKCNYMVV